MATEFRNLRVRLTDAELEEKGGELASLNLELNDKEAELSRATEDWKDAKKAREAGITETRRDMSRLAQEIDQRAVERSVECAWYASPARGWKYLVRQDTQEAIEQRPLTDEERGQMRLDGMGDGEGLPEATEEQAAALQAQLTAPGDYDRDTEALDDDGDLA